MVTANRYFYVATFLPVVSELDYLLVEHVVFLDDLDFCLWEMLQQGGSALVTTNIRRKAQNSNVYVGVSY